MKTGNIENCRPPMVALDLKAASSSHSSRQVFAARCFEFVKFCVVGGSGLVVDMLLLYLLADPKCLGLDATLSKAFSAVVAMLGNFALNEVWTFRLQRRQRNVASIFRRLLAFSAICVIGIAFAVMLLHVFHTWLGWNLYVANLSAILIVTCWNFGMNARFNWRIQQPRQRNAD